MSNHDSAIAGNPGYCPFDFPATTVTSKFSSILRLRSHSIFSMGTNQIPAFFQKNFSQRITVLGPICDQWCRLFTRWDFFDDFFDKLDLSRRSALGPACKWDSFSIYHQHNLCTLSPLGFPDSGPPFLAGEKVPSTNTSSQSIRPFSSRVSRKPCQIAARTSSRSHSASRRQQVLGEGYRSGRSRHRAPLRRTHKIPSKQARLSAAGRPPLADRSRVGIRSSILFHCSSLTKTSCCLAIERSPFNSIVIVTL